MDTILYAIIAILTGLAVTIPLVKKLTETTIDVVTQGNWSAIMKVTVNLITEAEQLYTNGADKKTYVLNMVREFAESIQYEMDDDMITKISDMIDSIVALSKKVNVSTPTT